MSNSLRLTIRTGILGGLAVWFVALVGMVQTFAERYIIGDVLSLGYILIAILVILPAHSAARQVSGRGSALAIGAGVGLIAGLLTALLVLLVDTFPQVREVFVFASPKLVELLTFGRGIPIGLVYLIAACLALGVLGGVLTILPKRLEQILISAAVATLLVGLLRDVFVPILPKNLASLFFTSSGLTWLGTVVVFTVTAVAVAVGSTYRQRRRPETAESVAQRNARRNVWVVLLVVFLATFPLWSKIFLANVADFVGLYIIMGLGLNLVVGFAGMLDLGYVGFYAIGAYTMAILTSPDLGLFSFTFWEALPFTMIAAMIVGIFLGLPVLRMRGDYLAIATLGFGEIIRILLLSDWLKPYTGGAQGITEIARPTVGNFTFDTPQDFYYLILIGCLVAWFVAWRLKSSRLGRAWMAIREDEDVAQAVGINRTSGKLMAFATGAFLGGLAGALFASMVGSVVPKSFELIISINVLALIIVGGMGSLPGVVVGALVLIGLPELLREFREYRYLVYGLVLMLMMLYRPEGLWPEATRRRELHETSDDFESEPPSTPALQTAGG